jgi:hypothetical protein
MVAWCTRLCTNWYTVDNGMVTTMEITNAIHVQLQGFDIYVRQDLNELWLGHARNDDGISYYVDGKIDAMRAQCVLEDKVRLHNQTVKVAEWTALYRNLYRMRYVAEHECHNHNGFDNCKQCKRTRELIDNEILQAEVNLDSNKETLEYMQKMYGMI